ncbi:hypothetical protein [Virgibacillus sp. DJP39]|uniref:hypothetical protein n=1 Tax=Virgibacillus sp. DJP39 TaxID=3409790 RepID=UPI003BB4F2C8
MKVALICPANTLYMPYVHAYEKVLKEVNVDYTIINWDRLQIEQEKNEYKYSDKKNIHQRNFLDYINYKRFIIKKLKETEYDKVVVFTLQLAYFIKGYLISKYKHKYIIDIRDYNKIYKFTSFNRLIEYSDFTVISSPGYKMWLPESKKYVVNHNTPINDIKSVEPYNFKKQNGKVNISTIGFIRHWDANINLVKNLKNDKEFNLIFHGEGTINEKLKYFVKENNIYNVQINGRYKKEEESSLYKNASLINMLLYNDMNSKGVLANRLYNATIYGKPLLSLEGTYLAKQIKEYDLGLVLDSTDEIASEIKLYLQRFNHVEYEKGRISFLEKVIKDNEYFNLKLKEFVYDINPVI